MAGTSVLAWWRCPHGRLHHNEAGAPQSCSCGQISYDPITPTRSTRKPRITQTEIYENAIPSIEQDDLGLPTPQDTISASRNTSLQNDRSPSPSETERTPSSTSSLADEHNSSSSDESVNESPSSASSSTASIMPYRFLAGTGVARARSAEAITTREAAAARRRLHLDLANAKVHYIQRQLNYERAAHAVTTRQLLDAELRTSIRWDKICFFISLSFWLSIVVLILFYCLWVFHLNKANFDYIQKFQRATLQ